MKRLFFILLIFQTFSSCKKSSPSITSSIFYKVDGTQIQIIGNKDTSHMDSITGTYYGCYAIKPGGSSFYSISGQKMTDGIYLIINSSPSNILIPGTTYNGVTSQTVLRLNNNASYGSANIGGSVNIYISRYSSNSIDGTFFATVVDQFGNKKIITDGILNNVQVNN